jgi:putative transposase
MGPELISLVLAEWAKQHRVKLVFMEPCKSMQNGFIERFQSQPPPSGLDLYVFTTLNEVREQTEKRLKSTPKSGNMMFWKT